MAILCAGSSCGPHSEIFGGGSVRPQVNEVKNQSPVGAAFFDIDGTLVAKPSLERRFFLNLCRQGKIPMRNCFAWLREAMSIGLRDIRVATQANKMYLRGVAAETCSTLGTNIRGTFTGNALPEIFPAAVQRVWWHALRGDSIVLVSGTLAPLAEIVKYALERELSWRGVETKISVLATQLEIREGRFTGRVAGAAMFGDEKARASKEFACSQNISPAQCSAYGDSSLDRWMLAAVGHPFAVNSTSRLRRIARLRGWQMLAWTHCPVRTAGEQQALKLKDEAAR
jgi:HAD superfamily hydrolase (TIGR01490 family)